MSIPGSVTSTKESETATAKPVLKYQACDSMACEVRFNDRDYLIVGRIPGVDVVVPDPAVSRWHCGIGFVDGQFLLKDLGSANGTFHNKTRVTQCVLASGDRIQIGRCVLEFQFQAANSAAELRALTPPVAPVDPP